MRKNALALPASITIAALSLGGLALLLVFTGAFDRERTLPELADTDQTIALVPVRTLRREGVIFPESRAHEAGLGAEAYWMPTPAELEALEFELWPYLDGLRTEYGPGDYRSEAIGKIFAHFGEFRRQYVGFTEGGSRKILVNCLLGPPSGSSHEFWQRKFIRVADGGFNFWHVIYDADHKRFTAFAVNGEA